MRQALEIKTEVKPKCRLPPFVIDDILQVYTQGLVQVVEELLVEDEGHAWGERKKNILTQCAAEEKNIREKILKEDAFLSLNIFIGTPDSEPYIIPMQARYPTHAPFQLTITTGRVQKQRWASQSIQGSVSEE